MFLIPSATVPLADWENTCLYSMKAPEGINLKEENGGKLGEKLQHNLYMCGREGRRWKLI